MLSLMDLCLKRRISLLFLVPLIPILLFGVSSEAESESADRLLRTNTLSVGSGSGTVGEEVVVALNLANEDVVKGLQTDITFDPSIVGFVGGQETDRGAEMNFSASVVDGNKVRVVIYYDGSETLRAGSGALAKLTCSLAAAGTGALATTAPVVPCPDRQELAGT